MLCRREFLVKLGLGAAAEILLLPRKLLPADPSYSLAELELYIREQPPSYYWKHSRKVLFDAQILSQLVPQFAQAYRDTKWVELGECAYYYGYAWWRVSSLEQRRKIARFLVNFADEAIETHPQHPFGYCTKASAFGLEILTLGILDSLHYLPHYRKFLTTAIEKKRDYSYGLPLYLMAEMFVKAPPFPISVGNLEKAKEFFEEAYPFARGNSALYYVFFAEYTYLVTQSVEEAKKIKKKMLAEMRPPTQFEVYTLDLALADIEALFAVIESGKYDKYLYSPLLEKGRSGGLSSS